MTKKSNVFNFIEQIAILLFLEKNKNPITVIFIQSLNVSLQLNLLLIVCSMFFQMIYSKYTLRNVYMNIHRG